MKAITVFTLLLLNYSYAMGMQSQQLTKRDIIDWQQVRTGLQNKPLPLKTALTLSVVSLGNFMRSISCTNNSDHTFDTLDTLFSGAHCLGVGYELLNSYYACNQRQPCNLPFNTRTLLASIFISKLSFLLSEAYNGVQLVNSEKNNLNLTIALWAFVFANIFAGIIYRLTLSDQTVLLDKALTSLNKHTKDIEREKYRTVDTIAKP